MTVFTGVVVYLLVWWTVLFCILPIGTRPIAEADPAEGGWRGTPAAAHVLRKAIATTIVSGIVWVAIWAVVESEWLSFRSGPLALPGP
jgi:predicted secreted protein